MYNISVPDVLQFVALRKESVDRNICADGSKITKLMSLSARRAWIEMPASPGEF